MEGIKRLVRPLSAGPGKHDGERQKPFTNARRRVLPAPEHLALLRSQASVQIQRARNDLGYEPKFDLARGGGITAQWLRWAGYGGARFLEHPVAG